jgi:hypothetical protein
MAKALQKDKATYNPNGLFARLAQALSYILHPAILMILTVALVSGRMRSHAAWVFIDVVILIAGLFPGLLYIYLKTRRGQFSHFHLLLKEERYVALPMLFIGVLASLGLYALTRAPVLMIRGMIIALLAGLGAIVISRFWKMSLHAAVAMGCAGLFIPVSGLAAGVFAILGLIVGLARVVVRHHTSAQVIVGWIYGLGMGSLSILWLRNVSP